MLTTLLEIPMKYEVVDVATYFAESTKSTGPFTIQYSDRIRSIDGTVQLVAPQTFSCSGKAYMSPLLGKYVQGLDGVFYVPADSTFVSGRRTNSSAGATLAYLVGAKPVHQILDAGMTISSGADETYAIMSTEWISESSDEDDLMFGSVCCASLKVDVFVSSGTFNILKGTEFNTYKVDLEGNRTQIGVMTCEEPVQLSEHVYRLVMYDNVRKLDKDVTDWVNSLATWPYALTEFYTMLCTHLGLPGVYSTYKDASSFLVEQFTVPTGTTGRQLMRWICEALGCYCVARADGAILAAWYRVGYVRLYARKSNMPGKDPDIEQLYYQNSLSYGDYIVSPVKFVQSRADQSKDSPLWPTYSNAANADLSNAYIITGNPILLNHSTYGGSSAVKNSVRNMVDELADRFDFYDYRPFKVTIPETPAVRAGMYAMVQTSKGTFVSPITRMECKNHRMILECRCKQTRARVDTPGAMTNEQILEYSYKAVSRTEQSVMFAQTFGATPGVNLLNGRVSTDQSFQHNGHTVVMNTEKNRYYSASDSGSTALEAWLDGHLAEMPEYSTRQLVIASTGALATSYRFACTLYRDDTTDNAVLYGFSYWDGNARMLVKSKYGGTWKAHKFVAPGS